MLFANNANTTLNGGITAVATSMVVTSATDFPVPTGSQYFYCTLADAATQTTIEIVKVTAVSGTTFTIVRGQDGTTGTIFASGAVVSLRLVRASLNDFPKLDEANTFSGPSSTFNNAPSFGTALGTGSGGTGLTTLTSGRIPYGNGTSAFGSNSALTFDGTNLVISSTILLGLTSQPYLQGRLATYGNVGGYGGWASYGAQDNYYAAFFHNAANSLVGNIQITSVATIYSTTSDYRLKTVIAPVTDSGARIDALEPVEYDWNSGGRTRGFLAHKFAEVYPNSVSGKKDDIDKDGKPMYQGMQASTPEVMADLIAEIQSLRKRMALLESK